MTAAVRDEISHRAEVGAAQSFRWTKRVGLGHVFGIPTKAEAATAGVPGFSTLRLASVVRSLLIPGLH